MIKPERFDITIRVFVCFCSFDGTRRRKIPRQKQEQARLAHKVKKEFKSAAREIKKDSEFLGRQQLREQMQA